MDQKCPEQPKDSVKCIYHEAHEFRFHALEELMKASHACVTTIKKDMQTKVNMKLFYATASGVFAAILIILGVQWGTYRIVNDMALAHERAMGKITATLAEVRADVIHGNESSKTARATIKETLDKQNKITEKSIDELKTQLKKMKGYAN